MRLYLSLVCALGACGGSSASTVDAGSDAPITDAPSDSQLDAPDADIPVEPMPASATIAGPLTIATWGTQPFLTPASIDEVLQTGFSIGRELFVATWTVAPDAQRPNIDGLGPLFHASSCAACHPAGGRPASLNADSSVAFGVLFRLTPADPIFGGQLQPFAISGIPAEATITFAREPSPAGISAASGRPVFSFATNATYGSLSPTTHPGPRMSPHLAGMGLLEAVTDATILAEEDPLDTDGDGISGRAARLPANAIGRFGWKAVQPSLRGQTAGAFAGDIGISSADRAADCTAAQTSCTAAPVGGSPEIAAADIDAVDTFSRYLGVPHARRDDADPIMTRGHELFVRTGCASCHRITLTTGDAPTTPALANVTFHAYTDLLLHDLGPDLADTYGEGDATAAEWRTPPLWGTGLVEAAGGHFLHDARAANLDDAIRWHGGEALATRTRYSALPDADRDALLAYLRSL